MFTELDQGSQIKIELGQSRSTQECSQGLREAYGDAALPYRTVGLCHRCYCHGPRTPLAMEASGKSTELTDMSPCDYDLFTKVKELLQGTRYNARHELIRAIGRAIKNIDKDGRVDGARRLPNIWQKVINKGINIEKFCISDGHIDDKF